MYCLIKEWPNKMATLMTEDGVVLWTFSNVEEAREVWHAWSSLHNNKASNQTDYLGQSSMPECNIFQKSIEDSCDIGIDPEYVST